MPNSKSTSHTSVDRRQAMAMFGGLVVGTQLHGIGSAMAQGAPMRWGSASLGSTGYIIIEALASTVSKMSDVKGSSVSTSGAVENMALIGRNEIDLGQTTSLEWQSAYQGAAPFKQSIKPVQLLSYGVWDQPLVVKADSGINKIEDLVGKRVCPGPAGGAANLLWRLILTKAGIYDKIRWSYGSWRETHDGMKAGAYDAISTILLNGRPASILMELETSMKMKPVAFDGALFAAIQKEQPGAIQNTLDASNWASLTGPSITPAMSGILGSRPEVNDETGYKIVKTIYENAEAIRKIAKELEMVSIEYATRFLLPGFPVNGGAAQYFKEKGVWRNELTIRT